MKKTLIILVALVAVLIAGYYAVQMDNEPNQPQDGQYSTFRSSEIGLEFQYESSPEGYVLEERTPASAEGGLVRTLTLFRAEDLEQEMPVDGEGPPVIAIYVFENPQRQRPQAWADTHIQYSNINLIIDETTEATVGGANAIRYMADGLYVSENAVVAHGENIYMITGQFIDQNSDIRQDFEPLLESVRFIPKPGQE